VKYNKVFRTLALAVILSLLVMAIPATPALAAESLHVSPTKGEIGDTIDVTGSDYTPDEKVYIYFSSEEADEGEYIDEDLEVWEEVKTTYAGDVGDLDPEEGEIDASFKVPDELDDGDDVEDVHGGDYFVYTTEDKEGKILAKDEFSVIGITIKPEKGPVGTRVEIKGLGFDKNKDIKLEYDGDDIDIASGDDDTDSKGKFTCKIDIPESIAGDHTITAEFGGEKGEAEFTVEPDITISPTSGIVGDSVEVTGTGFGDEVDVYIDFDGDEVDITGDDETDEDGNFEASFDVPSVGPGSYDVEAEDDDGNSADAEFTIAIYAEMSPTTGNVGTQVTVSGTGFKANGTATIEYDDIEVTTAPIGSDGTFEATFYAPVSTGGDHEVTVSDDTSTEEFTFIMESTPPPTPPPLLPMMDDKAGSMAYFDWEDVDDPSQPVTYTLQLATDAEFTEASILVEQEGLTDSEYTLTEEEALESTTEETPYYWRVRAIDGASNTSDWTGAGTFFVGFVFELTGWILYALMGLGGILLFFIGLWVGRRGTASY